ncbi:MAG: hypothetical protein WC561_03610 [Candidatus Omnitrophota bacterium]
MRACIFLIRPAVLSLVFFLGQGLACAAAEGQKMPNIVIITFAGLRNSESIDDPTHQYMPHIWNQMRKEGTFYNNLASVNMAFHVPSLSAIISGRKYASFIETLYAPSLAQYLRKKTKLPKTKFWEVNIWTMNDRVCVNCPGFGEETYPAFIGFMGIDCSQEFIYVATWQLKEFMRRYKDILNSQPLGHPRLPFYCHWDSLPFYEAIQVIVKQFHPVYIDYMISDVESAHFGTFSEYVLALKKSDEEIYRIWNLIKEDPFYKDNTYFIVTVDHTRNAYYMQHNDFTKADRMPVWMYIYGPGIKKGKTISRQIEHTDIFATLAYLCGVTAPQTEGKVLEDAFGKR